MEDKLIHVDHTAIKVNQITIIVFSILGFILNQPWIVFFTGMVMLAGTIIGKPGFLLLYTRALKPMGLAKPRIHMDNPEPHRFSQGLGSVFLLSGSLLIFLGSSLLGWALVWLVVFLAGLNAFGGFCVGCFVYYWLARMKFPGFNKRPPEGTFPGMRPKGLEGNES